MAPKDKPPVSVRILAHPGNPEPKKSGVQTSLGDKFHGEIVELPADEAELLIGLGRAEEAKSNESAVVADSEKQRSIKVVTLSGECFQLVFEREETAQEHSGAYYLFKLDDLAKKRGERLVMLFRGGPKTGYDENYDSRLDVVLLNVIRRALDSGAFSFDAPFDEARYKELLLKKSDFQLQPPANDEQAQQFIINQAYWLGCRFNENFQRHVVRFDLPQDLEYLGVTATDIRRNIWRFAQQGLLDKTNDAPGIGLPTDKLVTEYESRRKAEYESEKVTSGNLSGVQSMNLRAVFVVHGHDEAMKQSVARFLEKLDLKPIILHEQANKGRTIIEKFEAHSSEVGFAVVLLSPDDVGGPKDGEMKPRARQNVVLELGYFIGKLGRGKVCALHTGDVELPSDLHGVLWLSYEGDWRLKLAKEIKEADIDVDLNKAN
jgi:predicted nucleotide-binding protein